MATCYNFRKNCDNKSLREGKDLAMCAECKKAKLEYIEKIRGGR